MRATILGSGCALLCAERGAPSVLIETDAGTKLLVDCGWSVPTALVTIGCAAESLDHILLTHRHGDHFPALTSLVWHNRVVGWHYQERTRTKPLHLHGYPGFKTDVDQMVLPQAPELPTPQFAIVIHEHTAKEEKYITGDVTITHTPITHVSYMPSVAYCIAADGQRIIVTGDMSWDERLVGFARNADLIIIDAGTLPSVYAAHGPQTGHLSPQECGEMLALCGAKQMVLTHLDGRATDEELQCAAEAHTQGRSILVAHDFMRLDLSCLPQ